MSPPVPSHTRASRPSRLTRWLIVSGLITILVCAAVVWIRRPDRHGRNPGIGGGDFAGCLIVGNLVLSGKDIYRESPPGVNTWPPLFGIFCAIPALLARPTPYLARALWIAMNYALVWQVLRMSVRLVHGRKLSLWPEDGTLSLYDVEVIVPFLLCARFIVGNLDHLQVNIVIFALILEALVLHCDGRDVLSGFFLALGAALKIMPVAFVPYLLFRRQYRVAAATVTLGTILFVSPSLVFGWARFSDYLASWLQAIRAGWGVGKMNQSVFAMLDRYLGHGTTIASEPTNALAASGSALPIAAWLCLVGIVVGASLARFRGDERPSSPASVLEYAVVFIASELFGPVTWKAYFVNLLLPCMLLVALVRSEIIGAAARRVVVGAIVLYGVLAAAPLADVSRVGQKMAMMSAPSIGVLTVLFVLLWLRPRVAATSGYRT